MRMCVFCMCRGVCMRVSVYACMCAYVCQSGRYPIFWPCRRDMRACVARLIRAGAHVNVQDVCMCMYVCAFVLCVCMCMRVCVHICVCV